MIDYNIKKHLWYYSLLISVFIFSLIFIYHTQDPRIQMYIVVFMSAFFVGFSLFHHKRHHDIHAKIVIEYALIGAVGIAISYFTISMLK